MWQYHQAKILKQESNQGHQFFDFNLLAAAAHAYHQQQQHQQQQQLQLQAALLASSKQQFTSPFSVNSLLFNRNELLNEQPPNKKFKHESLSIPSPSSSSTSSTSSLFQLQNDSSPVSTTAYNKQIYSPNNNETSTTTTRLNRKRTSFDLQNPTCPLCGLALRQSELAAHLAFELEKLENNQIANKNDRQSFSEVSKSTRYLNFLKIKEKRQIRLKSKRLGSSTSMCTNCITSICLNKTNGSLASKECNNEFCINFNRKKNRNNEQDDEEDEELNVDGDDNQITSIAHDTSLGCSACKKPRQEPLVSINCWHVHCKNCWLQSIETNNNCPHCNISTTHQDLRKIFL